MAVFSIAGVAAAHSAVETVMSTPGAVRVANKLQMR